MLAMMKTQACSVETQTCSRNWDLDEIADTAAAALDELVKAYPEDFDRAERDPEALRREAMKFAVMFSDCVEFVAKRSLPIE